ncbi:MAG: L,D-transpeptidase [Mariprofundaceae bacterium]|nr:L,D-transpeptidase [Mariprofundaceae bacterium]
MMIISISEQKLYHRRRTGVCITYPISTAKKGYGNQEGSWQTPLGKHRVYQKIGHEHAINSAFRARKHVGLYDSKISDPNKDWILSRILWLEGMQLGVNKRGKVDTKQRYIYIHGTHEEHRLGQAASCGCIRMANQDVIDLFKHCFKGESVLIRL